MEGNKQAGEDDQEKVVKRVRYGLTDCVQGLGGNK